MIKIKKDTSKIQAFPKINKNSLPILHRRSPISSRISPNDSRIRKVSLEALE